MPSRTRTAEKGNGAPAAQPAGLFYIFHGGDELATAEELAKLRHKRGNSVPGMAELNTSVFDGRQVTFAELRHVCDAVPFLDDRRLVIVHGLLARLASERRNKSQDVPPAEEPAWKRSYLKELIAYLPMLPSTTRLAFVETKLLDKSHPLLKFAEERGPAAGAHIREHEAPYDNGLGKWIEQRVQSKSGAISSEAAELLAGLLGRDLRLVDMEIDKLLLYVEGRRVVASDVRALVSQARELDIFDLVDCIGRRQTARALDLLHGLLQDDIEPMRILGMIGWQVRILIQIGDLRAQGLAGDGLTKRAGLHPFVVKKAVRQLSNFDMEQLESAHGRVVDTDWAIKTGQVEGGLALDLLVVRLCTEPAP